MSALEVTGLRYRYPDAPAPALDGIDLHVEPGELLLLAGGTGSGKSTLLRAASGLVPHFYGGEVAGRVVVGGLDTREHGPAELAAHAGTLLQDPETQVVMGTVQAELALGLEQRGDPPAAVARAVEEAALVLGIADLLDRSTHELSGGELQRVALGAAIAGRPDLLLLDEPISQLDPVAGEELVWLVRRLNEEWGTAVVISEHRLERVLPATDRVVVLERGRIAHDGAPREFLDWAGEHAPAMQTPAARMFTRAGLRPLPEGVKAARGTLRSHGLLPGRTAPVAPGAPARPKRGERLALDLRGLWMEWPGGRAALRGVTLALRPGERVALMGRNGAGKSTLLRHAAGLLAPTRGKVAAGGRVALLLQNPGDYLVHETVAEEASASAIEEAGLAGLAERHPRDLSGGERQRLALAVVLDGEKTGAGPPALPAAVLLDEPTRGMDRAAKGELATRLRELAGRGPGVIVATHDAEFAAAFADRVVLMGAGDVVADGASAAVLAGGWHFATETARILSGAGGALLPEEGAELLRRSLTVEVAP